MSNTQNENWPILDHTTARIIRGLFRSRNTIWANDHRIVEKFGLTWAQFETLIALRQSPPPHRLSPTELYSAVQITSGGLTKILDGLEKDGFIKRLDNPKDRRSRYASLSPNGFSLVEEIIETLVKENSHIFNTILDQEEQEQLANLLVKLGQNLK